jgi:tetratricopeptide (TPR) repeat protein
LGRTEAAEIAFEKAITQNPDSWYSYYALALSRCEYRRYYRAIQLCKRVIELKPDRASIAKAYQLMGSAQRRLPGQSLEEQEKGVAQGQSDRQIPAKESTIKSISHSWIALCSAELRGQGKGTTERSKISQLETLASICLADLATFYIEDADPKEVGQVRTISKDETRSACLRAERQLKQALSLKRVDATYSALYHYNLGKAYYLLQRYADATHELRIATRIIPDNVTYWAELALAYAYTVTCEDIVQSKNVANAVFLKYGNKTSRPLELTYAVLCSGFVTSGFKERSTKEIRDLNYEKYVIETIIDFVSEAPAEDFKKALVKTREAYKKLDECDKLHKKLIEEGESRRTKIVELIEAFLDLPYFLDLLYNVEQSKKRDEIEKKLEDFKRDSKKAEHVQVFRTLGQLYLEFEKKRDAEKLIEGLKQQLVKFHGKKLESAQISLALGRLYLKYDKKQEFKKLVKKLLRELEQIPCEGKELEYAQIALMLEKLCLEFDKKPASSRLNLACNKKWDFKKLLERLKQQLEHFEGEGKEWEHGQLLRILAELCFDTEQFEQAEAFYKQAIEVLEEKYPRETRLQRLRSLLASTFAKRGKSYEALQIVQEAISLEALGCDNHKMLGDLYFAQEEFERAIDAWKEALSRRDLIIRSLNDPEIDLKIGRTYAKLVQQHREPDQRKIEYQHALSHFKQALDLYESDQQQQRLAVYFSLGYFHFALGEYEDAIKYLRVSQKFGLARLTSTFYLAYAYLRRREYDECIEQFQGLQRGAEEELRKQPGSQLKTIVEGESIEPISLGEMLALAYWGQAFAYAERNTNLQKALCLIIAAQKQIEDTFGKKNISEAQFSARYPDCKGWLLYKQGKIDDAIRSLEQAVTLTAHTEIYLHLALAYESKLRKTTNKTQKEILATRVRTSCQHIQELDIDGQYEQQVNDLLQRLQEKG